MTDRTQYPRAGLGGRRPGRARPHSRPTARRLQPKTVVGFQPDKRVLLDLPGGGGYGDPFARARAVLDDVVYGYVSIEAAARDYGVVVRYPGAPDQLVRLPEHYAVDEEETARLENIVRSSRRRDEVATGGSSQFRLTAQDAGAIKKSPGPRCRSQVLPERSSRCVAIVPTRR